MPVHSAVDTSSLKSGVSQRTSHVEALKSSSIIGGSTGIVLLIRMVRTKVLAVLLGPAGVGLEAIFDSIVNLSRTLFDLGVSSSGVRQIAVANSSDDHRVLATTAITLRRVCFALGSIGSLALFLAREPISRLAFGTAEHSSAIGLLSILLLFAAFAGGQGALLQGMRRIGDLARMNILGTLVGTLVTIPIVWIWGQRGIAAYMVVAGGIAALIAWLYARRIPITRTKVSFREMLGETSGLLRLGVAFLSSSLLATGALFLLRILVTRHEGVEGAGQFQAASALSLVYVGFILQAMATDYYPRLTAVAEDDARCNQTVNEQSEISLLLALPGILGTLAFAPWVIHVFYSSRFDMAGHILAWQVAGMLFRVISWPMGFILMAKGRGVLFVLTDLLAWGAYLGFAWVGLKWFGLPGTGMAFLALYIFHVAMIYLVVQRVTGFRWSSATLRLVGTGVLTVGSALLARLTLPEPWASGAGGLLAILVGIHCLRALAGIVGRERFDRVLQKLRLPRFLARGTVVAQAEEGP